jgi:NADH-quinone oxidoreductase subunit M
VPDVFDHGRLGPAILFNAPQVGAYMTVVLIVPRASPEMLRTIALLALVTAVYGAALALVQSSARRACGYLFMSQSALVMAGLDCTSVTALAGGLVVWLSAGLGFAGLARCVLVLEARRGRLALTGYHGGYDRMPGLAISFLAMGLACTGFPGTLGFIGQELLLDGAVDVFPVMGFGIVIASALTGLAVLRMYFSLFCGRSEVLVHPSLRLGSRPREAWTFMALVIVLIGLGLAPRPLVDSRLDASDQILRLRQQHLSRESKRAREEAASLTFPSPITTARAKVTARFDLNGEWESYAEPFGSAVESVARDRYPPIHRAVGPVAAHVQSASEVASLTKTRSPEMTGAAHVGDPATSYRFSS